MRAKINFLSRWWFAMGLVLCSLLMPAHADSNKVFTIAVVPQFPTENLHHDWLPVLARLEKETGYTFTLQLSPNIPQFEEGVLAGKADFVYMNPYHEVMAKKAQGYEPLVRNNNLLTGILVVRKDSSIKSVKELDGQEIAFPAPNAFGASLWMRTLLVEKEKITIKPVYVKTHSNAFRNVVVGKMIACGAINNTLAEESEEVRGVLRVLLETPGVPPHPLSAHPRVPRTARQAVMKAWLEMANDAAGQELLKGVQMPKPVRADYARDYLPLEKLGVEKYVVRDSKP